MSGISIKSLVRLIVILLTAPISVCGLRPPRRFAKLRISLPPMRKSRSEHNPDAAAHRGVATVRSENSHGSISSS